MSKKRFIIVCITILLVLLPIVSVAQNITVSGSVVDLETGISLSGVNIFTKAHFSGTTTNSEGRFSLTLPERLTGEYLYFSSIGYKTDSIRLNRSEINVSMRLEPDVYGISELVVMSEDALLNLLRDAFRRIPENYSTQPVRYEVFYRTTASDTIGNIISVAEAVLDIFKNSYTRTRDRGQVMVVKSRKNKLAQYDSIVHDMQFYGGAYNFILRDIVFVRSNVINPNHFRRYHYRLTGMTRFDGRDVYIIGYRSRNSEISGNLYIDVQDLAYVKIESFDPTIRNESGMSRENTHNILLYVPFQDKWHLRHRVSSEIHHIHSSEGKLHQTVEHIVLQINTENARPIPYEKRLDYYEPFLEYAQQYEPDFWTGYNVLENNRAHLQMLETLFSTRETSDVLATTVQQPEPKDEHKRINLLSKMHFGLGVHYRPLLSKAAKCVFEKSDQNFRIQQDMVGHSANIGMSTLLGFRLNQRIRFYYSTYLLIPPANSGLFAGDFIFGAEYTRNIKPIGSPLFVSGSLDLSYNTHYISMGEFYASERLKLDGKTLNAGKLNANYSVTNFSVFPGLAISTQLSHGIQLALFAKYQVNFATRKHLQISEEEGFFLTRKTAKLSSEHLHITGDSEQNTGNFLTLAPFQLGLMIMIR